MMNLKFIKKYLRRREKDNFNDLINIFISSLEKGIQLDYLRANNQVLIQFFKSYDVKSWDAPFEIEHDSIICLLIFNQYKDENKECFNKFENHEIFKRFKAIEFYRQNVFYASLTNHKDSLCFFKEVLLKEVFSLKEGEYFFTLKAY